MFTAFAQAFAQLGDPRIRRVVWLSLAVTVGLYLALLTTLWVLLGSTTVISLPWAEKLVDVMGGIAVFALAALLFPAVVSMVVGVFLDDVADAVEDRHYPNLAPPNRQSTAQGLASGLRLGGLAVLLNLLFLPLFFVPILNLVVFYGLNGYLISREYFELVALRRNDAATARALRRRHRTRLWLVGAGITVIATIPILNMVFPVIGVAAMVHTAHRLNQTK